LLDYDGFGKNSSIVSTKSVEELRPTYGKFYGFEYTIPSNAEMVALDLSEYINNCIV